MPVANRLAQSLRHADHQQQVAVRQPRHPRVERPQHKGLGIDPPRQRRARKVDVARVEHEVVEREAHAPSPAARASRRSTAACASGSSSVGVCPTPGTVTSSAPAWRARICSATSAPSTSDRAPRRIVSGLPASASNAAPHVGARLAAWHAERLGDLHVIVEHQPPRAVQPVQPLGHRQPVGQGIIGIDVGIGLGDRARGMHPGRPRTRLADITADAAEPRRFDHRPDVVQPGRRRSAPAAAARAAWSRSRPAKCRTPPPGRSPVRRAARPRRAHR